MRAARLSAPRCVPIGWLASDAVSLMARLGNGHSMAEDSCRDSKDLVDRILDEMTMVPWFASRSNPKRNVREVIARLREGRPAVSADSGAAVDPAIVYAWRFQAAVAQAQAGLR